MSIRSLEEDILERLDSKNEIIKELEAQLKDLASKLFDSGYCEYDDLKEYLEDVYNHTTWLE